MDTQHSPALSHTAEYCRCGLIFVDGTTGKVVALASGLFAAAGLHFTEESHLPGELQGLDTGPFSSSR